MNVLIVEDEPSLANAIKKLLEQNGYFAEIAEDGISAIGFVSSLPYDLLIMDVMMPNLDGFETVRILRKNGCQTPILMLTARTTVKDKVTGLNLGADDYLTKPFEPEELVARVGALTRRTGQIIMEELVFSDLKLDVHNMMLFCGEESVQLSKKEFEILRIFFQNPTVTITKDVLLGSAWGHASDVTENNVAVYISFLRKKIKYLHSVVSITNIQNVGYRLEKQGS